MFEGMGLGTGVGREAKLEFVLWGTVFRRCLDGVGVKGGEHLIIRVRVGVRVRVRVRRLDGGRGTFRGKGGGFFGMFLSDKAVSVGIQGHHELLRGSLREPHLKDGGLPPPGIVQDYVRV